MSLSKGITIMGTIFLFSLLSGGLIFQYVLIGIFEFLGFALLMESSRTLRMIALRLGLIFDILIFGGSILFIASSSVTIAISTTIAGLCWTALYRPYAMKRYRSKKNTFKHYS